MCSSTVGTQHTNTKRPVTAFLFLRGFEGRSANVCVRSHDRPEMSAIFAKALVRVEHEGMYGGLLGDELVLADGQLHVRHKNELVCSLSLRDGVRVLHPPSTLRPCRVAVADAEVAISACDAADDLLFVLQNYTVCSNDDSNNNDKNTTMKAFFGRVHCSDAAVRLRRASTQLPPAVYGPFRKLAPALDLVQQTAAAQWRVWSRELSCGNGAREYLVATVEEFWKYFLHDTEGMYEVIRDDAPTRLFLDVEVCVLVFCARPILNTTPPHSTAMRAMLCCPPDTSVSVECCSCSLCFWT